MGLSFRDKDGALNLNLPPIFWKKFIMDDVNETDLEGIDYLCCCSLQKIINIEQEGITEDTFEYLCLNFDVKSSDGRFVELIKGGSNIPVKWDSRNEYVKLIKEYKLNEFDKQLYAIKSGFQEIVPIFILRLFKDYEVKIEICGTNNIDISILKKHCSYESIESDSQAVINFWEVLESFSNQEKEKIS